MSSSALTALPPPLAAALLHLQAFYRKYGARLPSIVAFLLALLIARQLAGLLWLAAPLPESTRWKPSPAFADSSSIKPAADPERIVSSHLFGEYQVAAHANAQTLATAPETSLNFTLLGILAGTREAESLALIAKDGNDEAPYKIGEDVAPGVNLQAIFPDRVILSRNGQLETLRLDKDSSSNAELINAVSSSNSSVVEGTPAATAMLAQIRSQVLTDPTKAANYIRVQPITNEGGTRGYRVYPGAEHDAFAAAGLKPGDVITAINGTPLDDPGRALQLLQSLSSAGQVSLAVERNGTMQSVNLSLTP